VPGPDTLPVGDAVRAVDIEAFSRSATAVTHANVLASPQLDLSHLLRKRPSVASLAHAL